MRNIRLKKVWLVCFLWAGVFLPLLGANPAVAQQKAFSEQITLNRVLLDLLERKAAAQVLLDGAAVKGQVVGLSVELLAILQKPNRFKGEIVYIPLAKINGVVVEAELNKEEGKE